MKNRVLETLDEISTYSSNTSKPAMLDDLIIASGLSQEAVITKTAKILDHILHNYAAFDIVTIDTLTHRIIRTFAKDLQISGTFEVSLDQNTLNAQAVDALIAKVGVDPEITHVLIDFAIDKADDDKSWDITRDLNEVAKLLHNENDRKALNLLKEKSLTDFKELSSKLSKEIKNLSESQKDIGTELLNLIHSLNLNKKSFNRGYFYTFIKDVAEGIKKLSYTGASYKDDIENYPFYTKTQKQEIKDLIDSHKDTFITTFLKLKKISGKQKLLEAFSSKLIPLSVLQLIKKELNTIKEDQNVLLISDFNGLIAKSLRDQPAAFLYERLGERYTNYFIDEFQDTSTLQWNNLTPLIDNAISSLSNDGATNSLLVVGDPKQAIYRWRGGEAEQFIRLSNKQHPFSIPITVEQLETNYRSHEAIIHFNNDFFTHLSGHFENPEYQEIYKNDTSQQTNHRKGGYISLDFIDYKLKEEAHILYPKKVLEIIQETLLDGFTHSDICILTRNNNDGTNIAQYLQEQEINVVSTESLLISTSKTVLFIQQFLELLFFPEQDEKKLAVLYFLSDLFEIKDAHLWYTSLIQKPLSELLFCFETYGVFINLVHFNTLTIYESLEYIIQQFSLQAQSDAYVLAYLDLAYMYAQKNNDGALGFIEYWSEKKEKASIVVPKQKEAVQIMSVHKSKGLEFSVVIYPYADSEIYRTRGEHQWYPLLDHPDFLGFPTLMMPHSKTLTEFGEIGKNLYDIRHREQQFDTLNILYVALTRAVERLYVVSRFRESAKDISTINELFIEYLQSKQLWSVNETRYSFGSKKKTSETKGKIDTNNYNVPFTSTSKESLGIHITTQASFLWNEEKQNAIAYGNLIHHLMSKIHSYDDIEIAVEDAIYEGIIASEEKKALTNTLSNIVTHQDLNKCFQPKNKVLNERAILSSSGTYHIPDRIEISPEGYTHIIDYKTGEPNASHASQIQLYTKLLEEMNYNVTHRYIVYINKEVDVVLV